MKMMIPFEGEMKKVGRVWLIVMACLCYCHFVSGRLGKGKWRLTSLVPVFYIFTLLPLYTTSFFFTFVTASFITWLSTFKLLLFAFGGGPIVTKSLPIFIATAALPFNININCPPKPKKPMILPLYLAAEIPATAILFHDYKQNFQFHPHIVLVTYCCAVFLLIQILLKLSTLLVQVFLGLPAEPPSDEPYLSTSLQEFWGRRWNLTVKTLLRQAVYVPVRSAASAVMGREMAALTGVVATFVVSGLSHELLFWYVIRAPPSWEMTMFFVVHGVCVVVEFKMGRLLPWFVAGPVTLGFVVWTSSWLFFPPLIRNGVDVRLTQEIRFVMEGVKEGFAGISNYMMIHLTSKTNGF